MNDPIIAVNEIFGPTIQGEGKSIGTPTMFLRLAGCNLACSWCDTRYAWDWRSYDSRHEIHPMSVDEIIRKLTISPVKHLVVTGGEPLLQQKALQRVTKILRKQGWFIELETAGTIPLINPILADQYNVSPKLAHSGNPDHKRINPAALTQFAQIGFSNFKFVVQDNGDWAEIDSLVDEYKLHPVYIMPEGTDQATLEHRIHQLVKGAIERGYNISPRLHIQLYGKKRGF